MKFSRVIVHTDSTPPIEPLRETSLVIWFEKGTDKVWLDWWAGEGSWLEWKPGSSIAETLHG